MSGADHKVGLVLVSKNHYRQTRSTYRYSRFKHVFCQFVWFHHGLGNPVAQLCPVKRRSHRWLVVFRYPLQPQTPKQQVNETFTENHYHQTRSPG